MSEGDWDIFCLESGVMPDGQISDAVDDISLIVSGTVKNTPSLSNTRDDTDVSNFSADHDSQADVVSTLPRDTRPVTVQYVAPSNLDIHTIHDSSATVSVGVATTTAFPPGFGSAQALLHHDEGAAHHLSVLPPKGGETPLDFLLHPQLYVAGHYDVPTDPMGATLATQLVLHCQTAQHHLGHTKHQLFLASSSLNGKCQPATNFSTRGLSSLDNMELYIRLLSTKYLFSCAPELLITSMFSLPRKEKPPWPSFSTATSKGGRVDMGYLLLAMYMLRLAQMSLVLPASAHSDGPEISLGEIYVLFA
jgi:hypothetical protein